MMARSAMDVGVEPVDDPVSEKAWRAGEAECGAGAEDEAREDLDEMDMKGGACEEGEDPHGPIEEPGSTPDPVEPGRDGPRGED
jgi:hypothetical protein